MNFTEWIVITLYNGSDKLYILVKFTALKLSELCDPKYKINQSVLV